MKGVEERQATFIERVRSIREQARRQSASAEERFQAILERHANRMPDLKNLALQWSWLIADEILSLIEKKPTAQGCLVTLGAADARISIGGLNTSTVKCPTVVSELTVTAAEKEEFGQRIQMWVDAKRNQFNTSVIRHLAELDGVTVELMDNTQVTINWE